MKKGMFFALAASSLLFSACSSDDAVVSTEGQNEAVQQIVLQVASSGDGLTTRAGRPLYSSQALQTIQNVRVLIYNADTKAIVKDAKLNWKESSKYDNHGRQYTLTYKGTERLEEGNYKVMAVGYSDNSDYTYSLDVTGAAALTGNYSDITATLKAGKVAEEVFAGDAALTIGDDKKITNLTSGEEDGLDVTLHRQVAGSFGYFQNIPASVNGKAAATLRLVVRGKNDKLTFNNFNSSFTTTGSTIKYYVNGSTSTGAPLATDAKFKDGSNGYVLYSIDLKTWFPQLDENGDGVLGLAFRRIHDQRILADAAHGLDPLIRQGVLTQVTTFLDVEHGPLNHVDAIRGDIRHIPTRHQLPEAWDVGRFDRVDDQTRHRLAQLRGKSIHIRLRRHLGSTLP